MEFVAIASLSACLLALLLAVRVVSRPSDNPPAAWALAAFLVTVSAFVADQIAYLQDWFARCPHAFAIANPLVVAIFPSLYLYVRGVTHPTARWSRWSLAHFGLPLLTALLEIPTYLLSADDKIAAARAQLACGQADPGEMVYLVALNLYALGYLALSWLSVRAGRQRLAESAEEGRAQSFRGLAAFVGLLTFLTAASAVLDFTPWRFSGSLAVALASVVAAFTAFWLLADHQPLLKGSDSMPLAPPAPVIPPPPLIEAAPAPTSPPRPAPPEQASPPPTHSDPVPTTQSAPPIDQPEPAAPASPTLRPAEIDRLKRRLEKLFVQEKIYLDAELSLQTLADRAETTRHKMSAAIREIYGQTFYQLVAQHRVQEAARRLHAKATANRTISDVAFSVGFNTLSAFNTAFKAEFGITPSKFREKTPAATNKSESDKSLVAGGLLK